VNRVLSHIRYRGEDVLVNIKGPHVLVDLELPLENQELLPPRPNTWRKNRNCSPLVRAHGFCVAHVFCFVFFFSTFYVLCRILSVYLLYRNLIFFRVSLTLIVNLLNDHNLKFLCSLTLYMYL
jgi:hypothetical protein